MTFLCTKGIFLHTDGAGIFQELNVNIYLRRKPFNILQQPLIVMISALNLVQEKKRHLPLNVCDNKKLGDCHNKHFITIPVTFVYRKYYLTEIFFVVDIKEMPRDISYFSKHWYQGVMQLESCVINSTVRTQLLPCSHF